MTAFLKQSLNVSLGVKSLLTTLL